MKQLSYTGIGSRQTPPDIMEAMTVLATNLSNRGWLLRSGHAPGADQAFEKGALEGTGKMEIFLPWDGFDLAPQNDPRYITPAFSPQVMELAQEIHPAWEKCNHWGKRLHARNVNQIIGPDDYNPVLSSMVVCWTPRASGVGGTGQALRLAKRLNVPYFDLADHADWDKMAEFVSQIESQLA